VSITLRKTVRFSLGYSPLSFIYLFKIQVIEGILGLINKKVAPLELISLLMGLNSFPQGKFTKELEEVNFVERFTDFVQAFSKGGSSLFESVFKEKQGQSKMLLQLKRR
jgi:hypothetical protein